MKKLQESQQDLLWTVKMNPGANTHRLAKIRGDYQSYERNLLDRLFRLQVRGVIRSMECRKNYVIERRWYPSV
ncbi:hypothetical protein KKE60_06705 [Patescibacteria group bacterium]|nr:hypothetical protein [Patescibacteria group bacterium]